MDKKIRWQRNQQGRLDLYVFEETGWMHWRRSPVLGLQPEGWAMPRVFQKALDMGYILEPKQDTYYS